MSLSSLSDLDLVASFSDVLIESRERLVLELEYIQELDRRKLFFDYPSLWSYLVGEHGLDESAAERKIRAARFLRKHPELKAKLESGALNLSLLEIAQGCAHREKLSDDELLKLLGAISGMSCRKARREIAARYPHSSDLPHDRIRPLTAEMSEIRFVAPNDLLEKLDEIRGLLAHSHPSLTMAELIDVLASEYRERHHPEEKARRAEERRVKKAAEDVESPSAPKVNSEKRFPGETLTHELTRRDGYRCAYVDETTGRRCPSTYGLQRDHIQSWFDGGKTVLGNLRWLCANHHARVSYLRFGGERFGDRPARAQSPNRRHPSRSRGSSTGAETRS